jgi:O-acetyl-ADP-ribose deacetylase (regulator of RNase III)
MKINYVIGDATCPIGEGKKIIPHVCNDLGGWGAGFVLALSAKWKEPQQAYLRESAYVLGSTTIVEVEPNISVANMIAQHGIGKRLNNFEGIINAVPPIRYDALRECLIAVNYVAVQTGATLHCPRFGAGLAGGDWGTIEKMIEEVITVDVYVYDLPERGVAFRTIK